jgi:hypothetical protein
MSSHNWLDAGTFVLPIFYLAFSDFMPETPDTVNHAKIANGHK